MKITAMRLLAGLLLAGPSPARSFLSTVNRRALPVSLGRERRTMMILASGAESSLESLKVAQLKEMVRGALAL